jgi:hypothetical protein
MNYGQELLHRDSFCNTPNFKVLLLKIVLFLGFLFQYESKVGLAAQPSFSAPVPCMGTSELITLWTSLPKLH